MRSFPLGLSLILLGSAGVAGAQEKSTAVAAVKKHLESMKASAAEVKEIDVHKVFPDLSFVAVRFPLWPVAVSPPEGLKSQNIIVVEKDKLKVLTTSKDLDPYFRKLKTSAEELVAAARAYGSLTQEFVQDGFYKFTLEKDALKLRVVDGTLLGIAGQVDVVPEGGNKGHISFNITVDGKGGIIGIAEKVEVVRGMRPRCQATYLLNADPVIRAICEDCLLVMGRAAEGYLKEQRAKAGPELQREIDRVWRQIVAEGR